jgi:hypothetical protein
MFDDMSDAGLIDASIGRGWPPTKNHHPSNLASMA